MEVLFPFHGLGSKLTISVLKIYELLNYSWVELASSTATAAVGPYKETVNT
jgi:hypothetical protein